ncbi:hypothetical protein A2U01_0067715, partial [Trifolium medium]|nr:hypothetical protein [Trifolium medium]
RAAPPCLRNAREEQMKMRDAQMAESSGALSLLTGATRHPLLRDAQMADAQMLFNSLAGATRHPLLRDAQLAEQNPNFLSIGAQRAITLFFSLFSTKITLNTT